MPLGKRFLVRADHLVAQFTGEISSKRMSGQSPDTGEPEKSIEAGLQSPPGRSHLASLMSSAAESPPHSQLVRFSLADGSRYLLTVTCLTKDSEPMWVLSTDDEEPPTVFWSISTENPEQIYNLLLRRARNPSQRPSKPLIDTDEEHLQQGGAEATSNHGACGSSGQIFLNRYEVIDEIGCGGMSRVYKAQDKKQDRLVAVKVLHPHLISENRVRKKKPEKRFEQEFKATMALGHQNIVGVYDYGFTNEGLPFMVMEYIAGQSLEQLLRDQQKLKLTYFLTIFYQVCSALSHAHIRGVIHRDVKPSNIMLVKTNNVELVKLLDFGIAKIEPHGEETPQKLTQTGDVFGSPYYMSPEQCKGGTLDARSDIYSLGCVMYQAITGKRPFEGDNAYKTIYMHVNVKPTAFALARPDSSVPPTLETIVMKCLEKEPHMRYQTAQHLSLDLQKLSSQDEQEEDYITKQTRSGTFYAISPNTGKEQPANFLSVVKLLRQAGLISDSEFHKASLLDDAKRSELGQQFVSNGVIDNKTLHSAVQCQSLIERQILKVEKAIIALHYCQRMRISLEEALEELGWTTEKQATLNLD